MKKAVIFAMTLLIIALLTVGMSLSASAEDVIHTGTWGALTWELNETTGHLTVSGEGEMERLHSTAAWMPHKEAIRSATVENGVTSIGSSAFQDCVNLTSVTLPNSVTSIGSWAFYGCTSLENVTLSENLKTIGPSTFNDCTSLKNITLPTGLTTLGNSAFGGCTALESLVIPESVTSIEPYLLYECTGLESLTTPFVGASATDTTETAVLAYFFASVDRWTTGSVVPDSLKTVVLTGGTSVPDRAFFECDALTSITLPAGLKSIGASAFYGCKSLADATIPSGVTEIGGLAFEECKSLTEIVIPNGVTAIRERTFTGCSSLASITLPDGITSIGQSAFAYSNLQSLNLPNVETVEGFAFYDCAELREVTFGTALQSLTAGAFEKCNSLERLAVAEGNAKYHSVGNCIIETASKTLVVGCKNSVIPADGSVTSIGDSAFARQNGLESIVIPDSVVSIGKYAFEHCENLASVKLSASLEATGYCAFSGCYALESIVLPDGLKTIDAYAFDACTSLKSVVIPSGVTTIGENAFSDCTALKTVVIPASVTTTEEDAFDNCPVLEKLIFCGTPEAWSLLGYASDKVVYHQRSIEQLDKEKHQLVCEFCEDALPVDHAWDEGTDITLPTHLTVGEKLHTCTECNETKTEEVAKTPEHTYGEWQKHNAEQHKKVCACEDVQYADHTWNDGVTDLEPTHLAVGKKTYTCTECGETKTEELAKTGEHSFGEWVTVKEPTSDEEGSREQSCACGEKKTESIAKLPPQTTAATTAATAPETTTVPEATTAPTATTAPAVTTAPIDGDAEGKSGCASAVTGSVSILLLIPAAFVLWKKKED